MGNAERSRTEKTFRPFGSGWSWTVAVTGLFMLGEVMSPLAQGSAANPGPVQAETAVQERRLTLDEVIAYALRNNPTLRRSRKDVEIGAEGVKQAMAEKMPRVDFTSSFTRYLFPTPVTPITAIPMPTVSKSGKASAPTDLPEFDRSIYDLGAAVRFPLYRGGRLDRGVRIAELQKGMAGDSVLLARQDLLFSLTSVYHRILALRGLIEAHLSSVEQLEAHRRDVELSLKAGTVPALDLLRTEVELAHAREGLLTVRNSLESAGELLKSLMGMEEPAVRISPVSEASSAAPALSLEDRLRLALAQRRDYLALQKQKTLAEERIRMAAGKRLPDVALNGQYGGRSGTPVDLKEIWNVGVTLTVPIFDGGRIRSEVNREKLEREKVLEEERALRLTILREVNDASLSLENAGERVAVTGEAIRSAGEALRIERLKYETGAGTNADVLDARAALLRAQADSCQALYDREVALAALRKAMGEDGAGGEEPK
jgi:outer membrane protein